MVIAGRRHPNMRHPKPRSKPRSRIVPSTNLRTLPPPEAYADASVPQDLAETRAARKNAPRVSPLPKWRLQRVQALVEDRIAEPLTLAELAAEGGVSRMHFAAQFRAATGMRPHEYLLTRRILRAMMQMSADDTPLAQLALAVGFQSQSHFSTVFKRLTGTTPAAWRNRERTLAPFPPPGAPKMASASGDQPPYMAVSTAKRAALFGFVGGEAGRNGGIDPA
jgi:AraC-like DNA-binding protein